MTSSLKFNPIGTAFFLRFGYVAHEFPLLTSSDPIQSDGDIGAQLTLQQALAPLLRAGRDNQLDTPAAHLPGEIDRLLRQQLEEVLSQTHLATFLSGGIDSPLVAAIAQSMSQEKLNAFTFASDDRQTDESAAAGEYARALGLNHHLVKLDETQLEEIVLHLSKTSDLPPGDYSVIPTYLVCRAAREYSDTILSGDGGDELFWGYAGRMSKVIKLAHLFGYPKWIRKIRYWTLRRQYEWNARYFDTVGQWYRSLHEHNFESHLRMLFPGLPQLPQSYRQYEFSGTDKNTTAEWVRWNEFSGHMKAMLDKVNYASRTAGIHVFSPLLTEPLVKFAGQVDWQTCLDLERGIGKLPLRQLLRRYCAPQSAQKMGFEAPMSDWISGPLRGLFEDGLLKRGSLGGLEMDSARMRAIFDQQLKGEIDRSWGLWILLSLALWEDQHPKVVD